MRAEGIKRSVVCGCAVATALLTGCAAQGPRPLYYWGEYQPQVYQYFKVTGDGPPAQLAKLEATVQEAQARGLSLPPGFSAHLGLLYLKAGEGNKAQAAFQTEEAQFPESKQYMDFLLKKKTAPVTPVNAAPPAKTAPSATPKKSTPAKPAATTPKTTTPPNTVSDAR